MAKWTLQFEGDTCEDNEEYQIICNYKKIYQSLQNCKDMIRSRIKYNDITDDEDKFLEELYKILYIDSVD